MSTTPQRQYAADAMKEDLLTQIRSGALPLGERLPGERALAKQYRISYLTARKAVNELIAAGVLSRPARGRITVCSRINMAPALQKRKIIAFVANSLNSALSLQLLTAIEYRARQSGYLTIACNSQLDVTIEATHLQNLYGNDIAGMVFYPIFSRSNQGLLDNMLRGHTPIVTVDHGVDRDDIDLIESDNFDAAYRATSYLISLGHVRIAHLTIPENRLGDNPVVRERLEGYRQALADHGLPLLPELIGYMSDEFYDMEIAKINLPYMGFRAALSLLNLPKPPSAFFLVVDELAYGLYHAAQELGLNIPRQLSVIGINNLNTCQEIHPMLTSMALPFSDMGTRATELLIARIEGLATGPAVHEKLKASLAQRQSAQTWKPALPSR